MTNSVNNKLKSPTIETSLITTSSSFDCFNTTATTVNAFGASTTANLGYSSTATSQTNISCGAVASSNTKTINVGINGATGSNTNVVIGSAQGTSKTYAQGTFIVGINGSGHTPTDVSLAGFGVVWNKGANASGASYLQNYRQGGSGGFVFELYDSNSIAPSLLSTPITIDATGNSLFSGFVKSNSSTMGIGYESGAGGAVTQLTSKNTAVTINKISGQITMHNGSLGAGVAAAFQVTNSTVTSGDVVCVSTAGTYSVRYVATADTVTSGAFYIRVLNDGATTQSEAVKVNFVVIKGVSS